MTDDKKDPSTEDGNITHHPTRKNSAAEYQALGYLLEHGLDKVFIDHAQDNSYLRFATVTESCKALGISHVRLIKEGYRAAILFPYSPGSEHYGQAFFFREDGSDSDGKVRDKVCCQKLAASSTRANLKHRQLFKYGTWDKLSPGVTHFHEGPLKALTEHMLTGANCVSGIGINGIKTKSNAENSISKTDNRLLPELSHPKLAIWAPSEAVYITFDATKLFNDDSAEGLKKAKQYLARAISRTGATPYDSSVELPNRKLSDAGIKEWDYNDEIAEIGHEKAVEYRELLNNTAIRLADDGEGREVTLIRATDAIKNIEPEVMLIDGLLPMTGLAAVYGGSGEGKSQMTGTISFDIASGQKTAMHRRIGCEAGAVIYVTLEGQNSIRTRAKAYSEHHGRTLDNLYFTEVSKDVGRQFYLLNEDCERGLIAQGRQITASTDVPVRLVVIDTLARSLNGEDENSASTMGAACESAERISTALDALVVFVHHSGKDTDKGMRGSSALKAACENVIHVKKSNERYSARVEKLRDGEEGATVMYDLKQVDMGKNALGIRTTSCVVEADLPFKDMTCEQLLEHKSFVAMLLINTFAQFGVRKVTAPNIEREKKNVAFTPESVLKKFCLFARPAMLNDEEMEAVTSAKLAKLVRQNAELFTETVV